MNDFLINGQLTHLTAKTYDVLRPSDGSVLATLPSAGVEDVDASVAAAKAAFEQWRFMDSGEKQKLFLKWADIVEARSEAFGELVSQDVGMGAEGLAGECGYVASLIRFYAGFVVTNYGDVLSAGDEYLNYVMREPLGVCVAMPPWNSPAQSPIQKIGPALAAGNTVVMRAPEEAPFGAMLMVKAAHDAGFPAGVVNVLVGQGPESGVALVDHPDTRLVSFTGSAGTGKAIAASCAKQMKRFVMELGGKSPVIVFEDAKLEKAADEAVAFAFAYQGQICCANTRILIHRPIYDRFVAMLTERVQNHNGALEGGSYNVGPLFNHKVYDTVRKFTEIAKRDGKVLCGGEAYQSKDGYYFEPTVVAFEDDSSDVCKEEIFGPLLAVIPFDTEADAIAIANNVNYGLAATVYSEDRGRIFRTIRRLESGTVWANCSFQFNIHMPWGGLKDTGIGREFGQYALKPYYEEKNVWLGS